MITGGGKVLGNCPVPLNGDCAVDDADDGVTVPVPDKGADKLEEEKIGAEGI